MPLLRKSTYPRTLVLMAPGAGQKQMLYGSRKMNARESVFALNRADSVSTPTNSGLVKVTLNEPSPTRGR